MEPGKLPADWPADVDLSISVQPYRGTAVSLGDKLLAKTWEQFARYKENSQISELSTPNISLERGHCDDGWQGGSRVREIGTVSRKGRYTVKIQMKALMSVIGVMVLLLLMAAPVGAERRGEGPAVEIDAICQERTGPGVARWKPAGECNRAYQVVVFDNYTEYEFCFLTGSGDDVLIAAGSNGCPQNSVPVTLTGDGSVDVCLGQYDDLLAPWSGDCITPAVI